MASKLNELESANLLSRSRVATYGMFPEDCFRMIVYIATNVTRHLH